MSLPLTYLNSILSDNIKISGDNTNITGNLTVNHSEVVVSGQNISVLVNDAGYLASGSNIPDANITESSVVQYSGALRLTESQIVDLGNYVSSGDILGGSGINLSYDTNNNTVTINSSYSVNRGFINITDNSTTGLSINGGYNVGALDLFLNGVKLVYNTDYTANDGSTANLVDYATSGDIIEYISLFPSLAQNSLNTKALGYYLS